MLLVLSSFSIFLFLLFSRVIQAEDMEARGGSLHNGMEASVESSHAKGTAGNSITITSGGDPRKLGLIDSAIDGKWQQFRHWSVGSQALTCGTSCIAGLNSEFAPSAPWEFELPADGGCFVVVDAFNSDNQYNVTDFDDVTIGMTSDPKSAESCGNDPDTCYDTVGVSKGSFYLGEGPHSIMITVAQGGPGSGFFRVTTDSSSCSNNEPPSSARPSGMPDSPETSPPVTVSPAPTTTSSDLNLSPSPTTLVGFNPPPPPTNPTGRQNRPPIAKCKEAISIQARNVCATCVDINDGSYDPDEGDTIETVQNPWGPYIVGTRNVTLIVTDSVGESDSCVTQVTVEDNEDLDIDSIDCGVSDWHVQPCETPLSFSPSYTQQNAYKPNTKLNGCPVVVAVDVDRSSVACERCNNDSNTNATETFDCKNSVTVTERGLSLTESNEYGFFLSWQVTATDEGGRTLSKRCGVCVGNPDPSGCRRTSTAVVQPNHLKRRQATVANECPEQPPSSTDGNKTWPAYSIAEIDNCGAMN